MDCESEQHHHGDPFIVPIQVGMLCKLGESAQELFCRRPPATELFPGNIGLNLSQMTEIIQILTTGDTNDSPFTAGAVTMDQGDDSNPLQTSGADFSLQTLQCLLHGGKPLLKIHSLPGKDP